MDNLNKKERGLLYRSQQSGNIARNTHTNIDNQTNHVGKVRDFDMNMYEKGRNWQKNGLPLSGAGEEFKKSIAFVKGYDKEKQISRIVGRRKDGLN